jgi:hypothetical protein
MRKASTELLEQGTQAPSPAPDLSPAETKITDSARAGHTPESVRSLLSSRSRRLIQFRLRHRLRVLRSRPKLPKLAGSHARFLFLLPC